MLLGLAGSGLVVTRDAVQAITDGAVVHAFAGEIHWHGALPDAFMSHHLIVLSGEIEWLEEDYLAAVTQLRADPPGPK